MYKFICRRRRKKECSKNLWNTNINTFKKDKTHTYSITTRQLSTLLFGILVFHVSVCSFWNKDCYEERRELNWKWTNIFLKKILSNLHVGFVPFVWICIYGWMISRLFVRKVYGWTQLKLFTKIVTDRSSPFWMTWRRIIKWKE